MLTKQEYIEILKERNRKKRFKTIIVDLVKEFLLETGRIVVTELIKDLMSYHDDVREYWIREAIFFMILNEIVDFKIVRQCAKRPTIEIWLNNDQIVEAEEPAPAPAEEKQDNFPVFLSPSVIQSAQEQISRLRCFLVADENNKKADRTNMVISITESKQLTLTFQAESFKDMETFISLITHKSWRDE